MQKKESNGSQHVKILHNKILSQNNPTRLRSIQDKRSRYTHGSEASEGSTFTEESRQAGISYEKVPDRRDTAQKGGGEGVDEERERPMEREREKERESGRERVRERTKKRGRVGEKK